MKKNKLILSLGILVSGSLAQATLGNVCDLAQNSNFPAQAGQAQIADYKLRLTKECELSSRFKALNQKLQTENQINLTDIAEYQAIRFVQREWLNSAATASKPVEIIYQIAKTQYALPFSQQSGVIWDDWANGVRQLEPTIEALKSGQAFNLGALKKIHRGLFPFYPFIDEHGEFAHEPNPGILKPTTSVDDDIYWWTLDTPADVASAKTVVNGENEFYKSLGLLTPAPKGFPAYVSNPLNVREVSKLDGSGQKVTGLFSGSSMVNRQNVELVLNMVDQLIKQAQNGNHMIWKDHLFTPAELAYLTQQFYVRVHPFYEGNGRTSRFLQELILSSFGLPHGASGDLMDIDALTEHDVYYQKAMAANFALLDRMDRCADEYKQLARRKNLHTIDTSTFSYSCRILSDRSAIWAELKTTNETTNRDHFLAATAQLVQMDQQEERTHRLELARRAAADAGRPAPVDQPTTSSADDCAQLSGAEKVRCETFADILKKIGH